MCQCVGVCIRARPPPACPQPLDHIPLQHGTPTITITTTTGPHHHTTTSCTGRLSRPRQHHGRAERAGGERPGEHLHVHVLHHLRHDDECVRALVGGDGRGVGMCVGVAKGEGEREEGYVVVLLFSCG